ncbi:Uncharacterized mitochondrial protein AtMg00710 [Striga hermonthica]|uniref:Uncharacterized mitochondrial protein AtMg00710 n=1 Tax=Striga hermonthica TaxID=68872 RepID=A0A9N7NPM7_STRHE|nr:Uncharacterized mitochondrial protein AtMg00710 [Striga hermonthica]
MIEVQFDVSVKQMRTDNGSEFVNKEMESLLRENGILHQRTCPYTPQQNGVVERKHRSILEVARSLSFQACLPKFLWPYSLMAAVQIINTLPSDKLGWKCPFELLHGTAPIYAMFRIFGCLCYAKKLEPHRRKFDERAVACAVLGYVSGTKGYRVYNLQTKDIFITRDIVFYEDKFPFFQERETEGVQQTAMPLPVIQNEVQEYIEPLPTPGLQEHNTTEPEAVPQRKGNRERRPPYWMKDYSQYSMNKQSRIRDGWRPCKRSYRP